MTASPRHARRDKMFGRAWLGLCVAALAPLTAFVAVAGFRFNVWSVDVGLDLLTLKVALGLAVPGVFGALYAAAAGLAERRYAGLPALVAVAVSAATVASFGWHFVQERDAKGMGDVSTNAADPPGFNAAIVDQREGAGADPLSARAGASGCAVAFLPTQVAPGVAAYGLDKAGFEVGGVGVGGGSGSRTSFWYTRTWDAAVRIRPGRTDVRVTARDRRHDGGEACRLARKLVAGMTA